LAGIITTTDLLPVPTFILVRPDAGRVACSGAKPRHVSAGANCVERQSRRF
jgi:hypothetical protein